MTVDLARRWIEHFNAFLADEDVPEDLRYAPGRLGEEPIPVLNTNDAVCYTVWLAGHGYITPAEKRWLLEDIQRVREETA
jgi:hypothetical protein